jgi:lysophospholipase
LGPTWTEQAGSGLQRVASPPRVGQGARVNERDAIAASGGAVHWLHAPGAVRLRAASWPGAGPPALLLHGRTEFMEKYLDAVAELRARGHAVWSLDWRGQGRSSRLLPDPARNHVHSFEDHLDDLDLLLRLVPPGPVLVMGQSMGAHLALRLAARRPGRVGRAVLAAPMIDFLRPWHGPLPLIRALGGAAALLGLEGRPAPGTRRAPDPERAFEGNPLTSCPRRFADDLAWLRDPGLAVGGATWGWLRAAAASIAVLRRPGFAEALDLPVLMVLAGAERIVDNAAARAFAARLPRATVLELPGARHEVLREHDAHQAAFWPAVDSFLISPAAGEGVSPRRPSVPRP